MKKNLLVLFSTVIPFLLTGQNTFPSSGNVGIGTLSPTFNIHVQTTGGPSNFMLNRTDGTSFRGIAGLAGAGFLFTSNKFLTFSPDGQPGNAPDYPNALVVYGSTHPTYPGQFIIGASSPGDNSKLSVKGRVRTEEVKVVGNIEAPDYVFNEDYKLLSLEEIEMFISQNKHLPEIPSAKEFKENGILLGQMSFDLLKKIEELTLYLIELNRINKELNQRLLTLESKIK